MKHGILFAALAALAFSVTVTSCRRATDPQQITTVDSLINDLEAMRLTLNELDTQRYALSDSVFQATRTRFMDRFKDTLDKPTAAALGNQFVQLRETGRRSADHRNILQVIGHTSERLKQLEHDLTNASLPEEDARVALLQEAAIVEGIRNGLLQVITNYQDNQRVLEQQAMIDSLLADTSQESTIR